MVFNMNQFGLTNQPGETMNVDPSVVQVKLSKDQVGTLQAGDVVKLVATEVGDLPVVTKASSGDAGIGVVVFNAKKNSYAANDVMGIALATSIVTMAAATAINRGVLVGYNSVSGQIQSTSGNFIGITLDIASVTGDIIRVLVQPKLY